MISPEGPSSPAEAFPGRQEIYAELREDIANNGQYDYLPRELAHIGRIHKPFEGWRPRREVHPSVRLWDDLSPNEVEAYWQLEQQLLTRTELLFEGRDLTRSPESIDASGALRFEHGVDIPQDLGEPFTDVAAHALIRTQEHEERNNLSVDVIGFGLDIDGTNTQREQFDGLIWVDTDIHDGLTWARATDKALRALRNPEIEVPDLQVGGLQVVRLMEYYDMLRFVEEHAVPPQFNS